MKLINPFEIDFPKTMEELSAIDAIREVPLLKALCNRRCIHVPGDNPSPGQILPFVEKRFAAHRSIPIVEFSGGDIEWREINSDLQLFIRQLQVLINSTQTPSASIESIESIQSDLQPAPLPKPSSDTKSGTHPDAPGTKPVQKNPTPSTSTTSDISAPEKPNTEIELAGSEIPSRKQLIDRVQELLAAEHPKTKKRRSKKRSAPPIPNAPSNQSRPNSSVQPNASTPSALSDLCDSSAPPDLSTPSKPSASSHHSHTSHTCHPSHPSNESHKSATSPTSLPPNIIELSPGDLEIFADLHNASPIDRLPPERQQKLYQLLATYPYRAVLRVISLPAPHGWGLQTSVASLERFLKRHEKRQTRQQLHETAQLARELLANKDATDADLLAASTRLANIRLLQLANDPKAPVRDLKDLFQIQIRLKTLDLSQQRLALQKERADNANSGSPAKQEAPTSAVLSTSPNTPKNTEVVADPTEVGRVAPRAPRADHPLPKNPPAPSAHTPPLHSKSQIPNEGALKKK